MIDRDSFLPMCHDRAVCVGVGVGVAEWVVSNWTGCPSILYLSMNESANVNPLFAPR